MPLKYRASPPVKAPFIVVLTLLLPLADCGTANNSLHGAGEEADATLRQVSMTTLCAGFMRRALASQSLDIEKEDTRPTSFTGFAIDIRAENDTANGKDGFAKDLRAECLFDRGALISYTWKAGPF